MNSYKCRSAARGPTSCACLPVTFVLCANAADASRKLFAVANRQSRRTLVMRVLLVLACTALVAVAFKSGGPLKTKKYKCIEVAEDEEIQIVKKKEAPMSKYPWKAEEEKMRRIASARVATESETEDIEMPQAKRVNDKKVIATTPPTISDVQRDSKGRPLILSPEHCKQVKHYANMYGVTDVLGWVKSNCTFAKMYVPGATCEEINILVASCYTNKNL
ncbi:unnamed protein product [Caenorhabditis auriculariae]|uniref:aECM cysteine-cradle domain-containing protein n=1 Tax=Caenorhabditis auriculariae TaxID=2777116 RepID=A0A8S1GUX6_9PELO|nr:unnamed protein product [Caenorhabditis auriculariae]